MLITCHNCETVFQIDKSMLDSKGQQVRCSVCAHVWTVFADAQPEPQTTPKINTDTSHNNGIVEDAKAQTLAGPKLRQDSPLNKKKKKKGVFFFLIWTFGIGSILASAVYASIINRTTITAYYPMLMPVFELAGYDISYSADNLEIVNLQTDWQDDILRVRGGIYNNGSARIHALPIKISVIDPSGLLLSTHEIWPDNAVIDASDTVPFFAQITIDADEKAEIQVDFMPFNKTRKK